MINLGKLDFSPEKEKKCRKKQKVLDAGRFVWYSEASNKSETTKQQNTKENNKMSNNSNSQSVSTAAVAPAKRGRAEGSVFRFSVNGNALKNELMQKAMDFKGNPLPTIEDLRFRPVPDAPATKEKKTSEVYFQDLMAFMAKCKEEGRVPTPAECEALWLVEAKEAAGEEFNLTEAIENFGEGEFDVSLTELYKPLNALIETINYRKEQIKLLWTEAHVNHRRQKQDAIAKAAAMVAAGK